MRVPIHRVVGASLVLTVVVVAAACSSGASEQSDQPSGLAQVSPPEPEPPRPPSIDEGPATSLTESTSVAPAGPSESQAETTGETVPPQAVSEQGQPADSLPAEPEPDDALVRVVQVKGLEPVGGVAKIRVTKGETAHFQVRSDVADEVHLHGYDISRPVGPDKVARFRFVAKIDGIFEIELEESGVEIAQLRVDP